MIHVSDLLNYKRCPKYCWNNVHRKHPFEGFYHMEKPFSDYWKEYLNIQNAPCGQVGDTNEDTLNLLKNSDVVCSVRFEYRNCRTRIPVLMKMEDGYKAIYPHLSAYPKESEAQLMKINIQIAQSAGVHITSNEIIYLNKEYIRKDYLDLSEFLLRNDHLFNRRNKPSKTIDECMEQYDFDLDEWIDTVQTLLDSPEFTLDRSKKCTTGRRCSYYDDCFDESKLPDDSILFLTTSSHKLQAYANGIRRISDLEPEDIEGFKLQYAQYMASKHGIFYDKAALRIWTSMIQYPISYLDFEWDTFAIPPYENMKAFDVLCFQYSLHIEDLNHNLSHHDFFDTADCREKFILSLLETIPKKGSILVYNMEGAEKLRLKQLGEQFPKYKEQLDQICDRMIDLSKPFECGLFYDNRMRGHYSLKKVLPVFTDEYSYHQLSIQNGLNAVFTYRTFDSALPEQKQVIRQELSNYCKMDTFAEYVIFHGLEKYLKEDDVNA